MNTSMTLNNVTSSFDRRTLNLSITIVLAVFMVLAIVGNGLVCYVFYRQTQLRKSSSYAILSLAIADLLCGALAMPAYIAKKHVSGGWRERVICDVFRFTYFFTNYASVLSITVISVERFIAIKMPVKHRTWLTTRKMTAALVVSWLDAAVVSLLPFIWRKNTKELCTYDPTKTWSIMVIVTNVFFPFLIMLYCNFYTVSFAITYSRRHRRRQNTPRHLFLKRKRGVICTFAIVVGVFILCWGPSSFYYFIQMISPQCYRTAFEQVRPIFNAVVKLLTFANSCLNPIIYCWLNDSFRKQVYVTFRRKLEARRMRNISSLKRTGTDPVVYTIRGDEMRRNAISNLSLCAEPNAFGRGKL